MIIPCTFYKWEPENKKNKKRANLIRGYRFNSVEYLSTKEISLVWQHDTRAWEEKVATRLERAGDVAREERDRNEHFGIRQLTESEACTRKKEEGTRTRRKDDRILFSFIQLQSDSYLRISQWKPLLLRFSTQIHLLQVQIDLAQHLILKRGKLLVLQVNTNTSRKMQSLNANIQFVISQEFWTNAFKEKYSYHEFQYNHTLWHNHRDDTLFVKLTSEEEETIRDTPLGCCSMCGSCQSESFSSADLPWGTASHKGSWTSLQK